MAHLIEPCCSHKHLGELRSKLGKNGTAEFEGYGDLSLTELLPPLVNHYNGVEMLIAAPSLPDQAAEVIKACMKKEWALVDGSGKIPAVTRLTVVADLSEGKSPAASQWLKDNPFGGRLTLVNTVQDDTVILMPDMAITGPVNMRYGNRFVAEATTDVEKVRDLWKQFLPKEEKKDAPAEAPVEETPADAAPEEAPADADPAQEPAGDAEPEQEERFSGRKKAPRKA